MYGKNHMRSAIYIYSILKKHGEVMCEKFQKVVMNRTETAIWIELYEEGLSTDRTVKVLTCTGLLPSFIAMLVGRLLSLYDHRLYDDDATSHTN